jgi:hypothetical protein
MFRPIRVRPILLATLALLAASCSDSPARPSPIGGDPSEPGAPPPVDSVAGPPVAFVGAGDIARCNHPGAKRPRVSSTRFRAPSSRRATTPTIAARRASSETATVRPGGGIAIARTRPPATTSTRRRARCRTSTTSVRRPGRAGLGYYAYRLGAWEVFALNSNVAAAPGSPQYQWLAAELAQRASRCSLAYWHHPVISEGRYGRNDRMLPSGVCSRSTARTSSSPDTITTTSASGCSAPTSSRTSAEASASSSSARAAPTRRPSPRRPCTARRGAPISACCD